MSARIVILNALDPSGRSGLSIDTQAALTAGATDVIPIATGVLTEAGVLSAPEPRQLGAALAAALAEPVSAMLVGRMPDHRVAAAVTAVLQQGLPEATVMVPGPFVPAKAWFAGAAARQQRKHFDMLLRDTTVAVMTGAEVTAWLGDGVLDGSAAGARVCKAGAYAAWIRDDRDSVRRLDLLVTADSESVLDYPTPRHQHPDRVPGALTALLGVGRTLNDAVAEAERLDACTFADGRQVACR